MTGTNDRYRVVHGYFVIHNPSIDGDGALFHPDKRELLQFDENFDGTANQNRAVRVRCDAIDAPELHYFSAGSTFRQPRGEEARDALLRLLGFTDLTRDGQDPSNVASALKPRGTLLTRRGTAGATGGLPRVMAYILREEDAPASEYPDGDEIAPSDELLRLTANHQMLTAGEAYPAVSNEMPARHQQLFLDAATTARTVPRGVWAEDKTLDFELLSADSIQKGGSLIYPSLFRKCIDYLAANPTQAISIVDWMKQTSQTSDPATNEDDGLVLPRLGDAVLSQVMTHDLPNNTIGIQEELRDEVFLAIFKLYPWHLIPLADPRQWHDLALGETPWAYVSTPPDARALLKEIAGCRVEECEVPKRHPFYHGELLEANGQITPIKVACAPVTPVQVVKRNILVIGWYPTAQFSARTASGAPVTVEGDETIEYYAPVGNIPGPWSTARYFDGYKDRSVLSAEAFQEDYLRPLGIDRNRHTWMTNLIKCFMFQESPSVKAYRNLGWTGDGSDPLLDVQESFTKMPEIAQVCAGRYLLREVSVSDPKLIITLGEAPCSYIHGVIGESPDRRNEVFDGLMGTILPAGRQDPAEAGLGVERQPPWSDRTIVHLLHPEDFMKVSRLVRAGLDPQLPWVKKAVERRQRTLDHLAGLAVYLRDNHLVDMPEGERPHVTAFIQLRVGSRTDLARRVAATPPTTPATTTDGAGVVR
jgi:endonuclease YncB( thermonuclease family)